MRRNFSFNEGSELWESAQIFPGGNVDIFPILFRLLTMQCKWTLTKHFTFSAP